MDEYDIAQEIRLERQVHKGSFLLLEGDRDIKRFLRFLDPARCSVVNCFGRGNLLGAIAILYDEGFPGVLGLADADFDRLNSTLVEHEGVIYSDGHDFDMDWACKGVLQRYLAEVAHADKCEAMGGIEAICDFIHQCAKPLSVLRYISVTQNVKLPMKRVKHHEISKDAAVDIDLLIDSVAIGPHAAKAASLKTLVLNHVKKEFDKLQLTNGHDFLAMLGLALQSRLGDRKIQQTWGSEVEIHIRLAYSDEDFLASSIFVAILAWQDENLPYVILKSSLSDRRTERPV
ncbi:DUF4435 domain-containing protein [Bradyrhizobium sp. BRP23]|uniref:DUF4435 domain-containing protein n=1 Tax=Bradyrhizobium sp. BRP23 TaxID=2793820 RepID=UPI001CD4FB79|nr:DUF4435 domain-containing protein [Bradyrhizobium sp. BRP23]MCA1381459.1 DUF4435 domain-containing protein [Bradyrhizobium sp. BRP05]MCA1422285.1 DUF4435 domain-containing protein [Bradyrhizobium sp. BRP23]